jgi:glyoxylase-like metal-dependent hydrolase (beta-lactamase superfamily II)
MHGPDDAYSHRLASGAAVNDVADGQLAVALAQGHAEWPTADPPTTKASFMFEKKPENFFSYRVGSIEVSVVSDGHITVPLTESPVPGVSVSDVEKALREAKLPTETVTTSFAPVFFRNGSKTTLIDTGFGPDAAAQAGSTRGLLVSNMKANGVDPADIDVVVVSHFHPDHVNGLLSQGKLTFPNAEIMVPEPEWLFWMDVQEMKLAPEGRMSQLFQNNRRIFDRMEERLSLFKWGAEIVPGLEAVAAPGHSIGHTSFWLRSDGEQVFIQSDLTNQAALFVANPTWYSALDQFPEQTVQTRIGFYDMLAETRTPLQAFHHPFPGRCYLEKNGAAYRRIPID